MRLDLILGAIWLIIIGALLLVAIWDYLWYRRNFHAPFKTYCKSLKRGKSKSSTVENFSYPIPSTTLTYLDYYSHFDIASLRNLIFEIEQRESDSNANTQYMNFFVSVAASASLILAAISNFKDNIVFDINSQSTIYHIIGFLALIILTVAAFDSISKNKIFNKLSQHKKYIERCIQQNEITKKDALDPNTYKRNQRNKRNKNNPPLIARKKVKIVSNKNRFPEKESGNQGGRC